jgi:hypothetical protein
VKSPRLFYGVFPPLGVDPIENGIHAASFDTDAGTAIALLGARKNLDL